MSIVITNISNTFSEKGLQGYVLKINNKEICRFTHIREEGLSQCLYRAYLETGGDDYIGDLIAKLADADAEIKRLEAEVEGMKCCGNCTYFYDNVCSKFPTIDGEYCDKWESDTLTQEDRK